MGGSIRDKNGVGKLRRVSFPMGDAVMKIRMMKGVILKLPSCRAER
jgi:hypothetical protein